MWEVERLLSLFGYVCCLYSWLQSALMVPTEILAEQHFDSLAQLFPELKLALLLVG